MEEAGREHKRSPFIIGLNFFNEVLVHHCSEGSVKTSLESLWWFCSDLDSHLKETKREFRVGLASNPKSELFMNFDSLRV
jgi:hypothetical protein